MYNTIKKQEQRRFGYNDLPIRVEAMQIRRTVRRVNALEKVFIPRCEAQVRSIAAALEENEREDMTRIKLSSGCEM